MAVIALETLARQVCPAGAAPRLAAAGDLLARVGGKALGLAWLLRAGLPVPPALVLEADAYARAFRFDPTLERLDPAIHAELNLVWRELRRRGGGLLAVRSSATVEDLPEASFAGQAHTELGVASPAGLRSAVLACYRSLGGERQAAYLAATRAAAAAGQSGPGALPSPGMALVIQRQVRPAASGVLFTADPRSGEPAVLLEACRGSGEALVGGEASPDVYALLCTPGGPALRGARPGLKLRAVYYDRHGRRAERDVPPGRRAAFCLSPGSAVVLAQGALRVEGLLGRPQDIEWAVERGGQVWFLQCRPLTALTPGPAGLRAVLANAGGLPDPWGYNDTLARDCLWTNVNVGEGLPGVLTPFSWSLARLYLERAALRVFGVLAEGLPLFGNLCGRLYLNLSGRASVARALAWPLSGRYFERLLRWGWEEFWGHAPARAGLPLAPFSPLRAYLRLPHTLALAGLALGRYLLGFGRFRRDSPALAETLRRRIEAASGSAELAAVWRREVEPRLVAAGMMVMFTAAAAVAGSKQLGLAWPLLRRSDGRSLAVVTSSGPELESVRPAAELWRISRLAASRPALRDWLRRTVPRLGELGWSAARSELAGMADGGPFLAALDGFLDRHGHRSETEFEVSTPSWREDPAPLLQALRLDLDLPDHAGPGVARLRRAAEAEGELQAVRSLSGPRALAVARRLLGLYRLSMARREQARDLLVLWASLGRDFIRAAGRFMAAGGWLEGPRDAVFLELGEVLAALDGGLPGEARALAAARRLRYDYYRTLPDPPKTVRGRLLAGDLQDDGARPGIGPAAPIERDGRGRTLLRGLPASPGRAVGRARLLRSPREAGLLRQGEVLVARTANVGWTILFQSLRAVVTDVGAPFSHAAIVARELRLPAVVDTVAATLVLRDGDLLAVDGDRGQVTRLLRRRLAGRGGRTRGFGRARPARGRGTPPVPGGR